MNEKYNEQDLRKALIKANNYEFEYLLSIRQEEVEFSDSFIRRMNVLFQQKNIKRIKLKKLKWKRTLLIVAVFVILASSAVIANPITRKYIVGFFIEDHGSYTQIENGPQVDTKAAQFVVYEPQWLPEGCELISETVEDGMVNYLYSYGDGYISISQLAMDTASSSTSLDTGDAVVTEFTLHGVEAIMYANKNSHTIIWTEQESNINITGIMDGETAKRVAEGFLPKE